MKYWHEFTDKEVQSIYERGMTVGEVMKECKQPDWCDYPDALAGKMGCWSLTGSLRKEISPAFCRDCDLCNLSKAQNLPETPQQQQSESK